jgi:hypothetical protein
MVGSLPRLALSRIFRFLFFANSNSRLTQKGQATFGVGGSNPFRDARRYESFRADIRQKIEARFGPGQLLVDSKKPEAGVIQTLVGYKWTQPTTAIKLVYFSAENADHIYRAISVHYLLQ